MDSHDEPKLSAPPKLVDALSRVSDKVVFVPPAVDEAIIRAAHRHLQPRRRIWLRWPRLLPATAVTLLLFGWALWIIQPFSSRPAKLLGDVNGDGQIDILDAFALARCVKTSPSACLQFDMNGDGVIDRSDIELLASRAVRLERPGGS